MTDRFQNLIEFLKTPFPYFFIIASLLASAMLLSEPDFLNPIYDKEMEIEKLSQDNSDLIYAENNESHFIACGTNYNEFEFGETIKGIATILSLPSLVATAIFIKALQIDYPSLHPETYELFAILAFIYFNVNFSILLAYTIYKIHDDYRDTRPQPNPPLSILPK